MAGSTWRIIASPQLCRHDKIASRSIHHIRRKPAIKAAEFFNTTLHPLPLVEKPVEQRPWGE
jgi:hypothetical protein